MWVGLNAVCLNVDCLNVGCPNVDCLIVGCLNVGCPNVDCLNCRLPQSQPNSVLALLCRRQQRVKPGMNTYLHDDDFDHDDEDFDDCEVVFHIPFWIPPLSLDKYILAYIVFYFKTENKQVYLFVGRPCFS